MTINRSVVLFAAGAALILSTIVAFKAPKNNDNVLFFDKPAANWYQAIPIGNGSIGGMVYGGVESDTIKLNEETLWSGGPRDLQNHTALEHLPKIRQLLLDGKTEEAQNLINKTMLGEWNESYMPMGDLILTSGASAGVTKYRRQLDMNNGVASVNYSTRDASYSREVFVSYPDKAVVMKLKTNKKGKLNLSIAMQSALRYSVAAEGKELVLRGKAPKHTYPNFLGIKKEEYGDGFGMDFQIRLLVRNKGGKVAGANGRIAVTNADEVELILTAATSFNGFDKNPVTEGKDVDNLCTSRLRQLKDLSYEKLKQRHVDDYSSLFGRVSLNLGADTRGNMPIDQRIKNYSAAQDPGLTALYFQFGRYLLISSSRPGQFAQPANLQGIWNQDIQPGWSSNWTLNCNSEINYWPAEITNLSECHIPLIEMTRDLSVDGAKTARNLYGAGGWIAHHNADLWRTTSPVGGTGLWAIYQVGSAWLCHHVWEHYEFTLDKKYLQEMYPVMKGAAQFYLDNLQRDQDGFLVTNPSESFENQFKKPDGTEGWACVGATQDMQIIRDLFTNCIAAADVLGEDAAFRDKIQSALKELLPMRISPRTGQLQEWKDDWDASQPFGGQVAHGWALAVGNAISPRETPELAAAFRKTIEYRKPWSSYNCGSWVGSFSAKYWARLGDGKMLQMVLDTHFVKAMSPNLTSRFMDSWQIDGNLGITASISEMLVQSHLGYIELLPALSPAFPTGEVSGLCARGGFEISMQWKDGKVTEASVLSKKGGKCKVLYNGKEATLNTEAGKRYQL